MHGRGPNRLDVAEVFGLRSQRYVRAKADIEQLRGLVDALRGLLADTHMMVARSKTVLASHP